MAGALNRGPVIFFLYNFHGVAVEGYKSGGSGLHTHIHGPGVAMCICIFNINWLNSQGIFKAILV